MERDFPAETAGLRADVPEELLRAWFRSSGDVELLKILAEESNEVLKPTAPVAASDDVSLSVYARGARYRKALKDLDKINLTALRRTVLDLAKTFGGKYYGSNSYWPNAIFYARPIRVIRRRSPALSRVITSVAWANW